MKQNKNKKDGIIIMKKEITFKIENLAITVTEFSDEIFNAFFEEAIKEADINNCIRNYCINNPKKVDDLKRLFNALAEPIFNKAVEDGVELIDEDYFMQFSDDPVTNAIEDAFDNALDEIAEKSGYIAMCDEGHKQYSELIRKVVK